MENKCFFRWFRVILSIPLFILLVSSPTDAQTEYPYKEVTPGYIEAGNPLGLTGDDASSPVTLPFPFTFYGSTYTTAWVSTNGFLSFVDSWSGVDNPPSYFPPPNSGLPNGAIYAFWDDLDVNAYNNASVRTEVFGAAPKRQFVIEWRNVMFKDPYRYGNSFDFEIVLHEGTGAILLQYRNIDSMTDETGISTTIGLENQTGSAAALFSHDRPAIKAPEFAILFGKVAQNVPVDIKPKRCPNPVNLVRKGVLRVAILGTANVPVSAIDPNSVTLQGITPQRWHVEDVGTPYDPFVGKTDIYNCNNLGPDGYPDLIFKFDTEDVVGAPGGLQAGQPVQAGQALLLKLDGKLLDGTEIKGEDSVVIIRGHHKWEKEKKGHHEKEKVKDHHKKEKDRDHGRDHDRDDDRDDDDD